MQFKSLYIEHLISEKNCSIQVDRVHGDDGKISNMWRTIELQDIENAAKPGKDYEEAEGTLEFENCEVTKQINVTIIPHNKSEEGL